MITIMIMTIMMIIIILIMIHMMAVIDKYMIEKLSNMVPKKIMIRIIQILFIIILIMRINKYVIKNMLANIFHVHDHVSDDDSHIFDQEQIFNILLKIGPNDSQKNFSISSQS